MITFDDLVLIEVQDAADRLGKPEDVVRELVRHEVLAAVMHGGRYMLAEEEVDRYAERLLSDERSGRHPRSRRFLPPPRDPNQHVLWE